MYNFKAEILSPCNGYINKQTVHMCIIYQSTFTLAGFWGMSVLTVFDWLC